MYEEQTIPIHRRVLWIALWAVLALVVIGVAVWLLFFRNASDTTPSPSGRSASQSHQTSSQPSSKNPAPTQAPAGTSSQSPSAPQPAQTNQPASAKQLANTGPGNLLPLAAAVSVGVAGAHQLYIRRKFGHTKE